MNYYDLSEEQQAFIQQAGRGSNILVDACIGSGKTTAIQTLCSILTGKRILYLTYNALLKLDAKAKIQSRNARVTNYHGFAMGELLAYGRKVGIPELLSVYNQLKPKLTRNYDLMVLDEYQDLATDSAEVLLHIKESCPGMQIISVGDMAQKLYDHTTLDVQSFLGDLMGDYVPMEFTKCFRLNAEHAAMLSRIWGKKIVGVNQDCEVVHMTDKEVREFASRLNPSDFLVLGSGEGQKRTKLQNYLEENFPDKFNPSTVWAKKKGDNRPVPNENCCIFTTYDGCKGMERPVCIIYDWEVSYWESRLEKTNTRYEIMRNVFCVAASRGKSLIIFVTDKNETGFLTEEVLAHPVKENTEFSDMAIDDMFGYKYAEDVDRAYKTLSVSQVKEPSTLVPASLTYKMIDLGGCINYYLLAGYFRNYRLETSISYQLGRPGREHLSRNYLAWNVYQKIQYLMQLETLQNRYFNQVPTPFITREAESMIRDRLAEHLPDDVLAQRHCQIRFYNKEKRSYRHLFDVEGYCDIIYENQPWSVIFSEEINHDDCLKMGVCLASLGYKSGRILNVMTGEVLEISIPDVLTFLDKAVIAVTKGNVLGYMAPAEERFQWFMKSHEDVCRAFLEKYGDGHPKGWKYVSEFFDKYNLRVPVSPYKFANYLFELQR